MATLYMGIGIPGSGKTTYLKPYAEQIGAIYICPDDVCVEIHGNAANQSNQALVWHTVYQRMRAALRSGSDVVLDSTMAKEYDRLSCIRACPFGTEVVGIWFQTPIQTCLVWNMHRSRTVPEHGIRNMRGLLSRQPPQKLEGFTRIDRVDMAALARKS